MARLVCFGINWRRTKVSQDRLDVRYQECLEVGAHFGRVLNGEDAKNFVAQARRSWCGDAMEGHGRGTGTRGGKTKGRRRSGGPGGGRVWIGSEHEVKCSSTGESVLGKEKRSQRQGQGWHAEMRMREMESGNATAIGPGASCRMLFGDVLCATVEVCGVEEGGEGLQKSCL